jgi:hypothetical protein
LKIQLKFETHPKPEPRLIFRPKRDQGGLASACDFLVVLVNAINSSAKKNPNCLVPFDHKQRNRLPWQAEL